LIFYLIITLLFITMNLLGITLQVASYSAKGLRAAKVTGDSSKSLRKEVQEGQYQLVYITPELLITGSTSVWRKMLVGEVYSERLRAFIIDEAHTVKKW